MELTTSASIDISVPRSDVFDYLTSAYPAFLKRWLIYPAITSSEVLGESLEPGVGRTIRLSDGGVLDEEIRLHDPPTIHSYRWSGGVAFPTSLLVAGGGAVWHFSDGDDGTQVEWSYTFELTSPLWWPVAKLMMLGYRRWMKKGLRLAKEQLEA